MEAAKGYKETLRLKIESRLLSGDFKECSGKRDMPLSLLKDLPFPVPDCFPLRLAFCNFASFRERREEVKGRSLIQWPSNDVAKSFYEIECNLRKKLISYRGSFLFCVTSEEQSDDEVIKSLSEMSFSFLVRVSKDVFSLEAGLFLLASPNFVTEAQSLLERDMVQKSPGCMRTFSISFRKFQAPLASNI